MSKTENAQENNTAQIHALIHAAGEGDTQRVRELLASAPVANETVSAGVTALMCAARNGHADVAKTLIEAGADVNAKNSHGTTPLIYAAAADKKEMVRLLLHHGAQINACNNQFETALMFAAIKGYHETLEELLRGGADTAITRRLDGCSAIQLAAGYGHTEAVTKLIDAGANVNHTNRQGRTALIFAVQNDHHAIVTKLIAARAHVDIRCPDGLTALLIAIRRGHTALAQELISAGADVPSVRSAGITDLTIATLSGRLDLITKLIEAGASINQANSLGQLPEFRDPAMGHPFIRRTATEDKNMLRCKNALMIAARRGDDRVVDYLIQKGADVHAQQIQNGGTALCYAAEKGHVTTALKLIQAGAHINICNNSGETPLIIAAEADHLLMGQLLLSHNAETHNQRMYDRKSAVMLAAHNGNARLTELLLQRNAEQNLTLQQKTFLFIDACERGMLPAVQILLDRHPGLINNSDDEGYTGLLVAAARKHHDVAQLLVHRGAQVNYVCDRDGATALMDAAENGDCRMIELLMSNGADISIQDNQGESAFMIAAANGHLPALKTLIRLGADIQDIDYDGNTALHGAAECGHLDIISELCSIDPSLPKVTNDLGSTPLMVAAERNHCAIIDFLVPHNPVNHQNYDGYTACMYAAQNGHTKTVKHLLALGAQCLIANVKGETALHIAAHYGRTEVLKELIKADKRAVYACTKEGLTPLMVAAKNNKAEIIEILAAYDSIDSQDKEQKTALHHAVLNKCRDALRALIALGARMHVRDAFGKEPGNLVSPLDVELASILAESRHEAYENRGGDAHFENIRTQIVGLSALQNITESLRQREQTSRLTGRKRSASSTQATPSQKHHAGSQNSSNE